MKLWTAITHYEATGEGVTMQVMICYAKNQTEMEEKFKEKVGDFFSKIADYEEGVSNNPIVSYLFSEKILDRIRKAEGSMNIVMYNEFHINGA